MLGDEGKEEGVTLLGMGLFLQGGNGLELDRQRWWLHKRIYAECH